MKIHWLQHVSFEGLGCIGPWLAANGHTVTYTRFWAGDALPAAETVDGLIVMGGPMGVYDEALYSWMAAEKAFIKKIIAQDKPVLGICLGAQLIAEVLGAKVWKNDQREIGFFPVFGKRAALTEQRPPGGLRSVATACNGWTFPAEFTPFHWHGDTFGIPPGAKHLASSKATENQAFIYKDNVLALQFHLETTEESLMSLYENGRDEITAGPFMQTLDEMRRYFHVLGNANALMHGLLARLF